MVVIILVILFTPGRPPKESVEGVDVTTGVGVVEAGLVGVLVRAIEHDVPVVGGVPPRRGGDAMRRYSSDGPEVVVVAAAEEAKAEGACFIDKAEEAERWRFVFIIMEKSPAIAEVSSSEETLAALFFRLG